MKSNLYDILLSVYGSEAAIARTFGVERAAHWKKKVPEHVALLCHLSPDIPYQYNPTTYQRDVKGLRLILGKPTTNDEVTTNDDTIYLQAS